MQEEQGGQTYEMYSHSQLDINEHIVRAPSGSLFEILGVSNSLFPLNFGSKPLGHESVRGLFGTWPQMEKMHILTRGP